MSESVYGCTVRFDFSSPGNLSSKNCSTSYEELQVLLASEKLHLMLLDVLVPF